MNLIPIVEDNTQFEEDEESDDEYGDEWFKEDWDLDDDWNKIEPVDDYEKLEDGGI
jgi:hypothetical protein